MGDGIEGAEYQLLESASPWDWLITLCSWADAIPLQVSSPTPDFQERVLPAQPEPGQSAPGAECQIEHALRLCRKRAVQEEKCNNNVRRRP